MSARFRSPLGGWLDPATAMIVFGIAFGFVEAAVVVDLRAVYEPLRQRGHPGNDPSCVFPSMTLAELRGASQDGVRLLKVELVREAATIVMLAAAGAAIGGSYCRRFAAFLVAFGVWDLAFYLSLRLLIGWPTTLLTWDLLFLLPVPWSGPVLSPMIVALTMISCGLHALARDADGRPVTPRWHDCSVVTVGGALIFASFVLNYSVIMTGGVPTTFHWYLFATGELVAIGGYAVAAARRPHPCPEV